jgi:ribonuclease HI
MDKYLVIEDPRESDNVLIVFTDGACSGNGTSHARAAYAVIWPEHTDLDGAYLLRADEKHTNNRAELTAILHAIRQADRLDPDKRSTLIIYTDSMLAVNSLTKWMKQWKANNWMKSSTVPPSPVLNQDILSKIDEAMQQRKMVLRHVRAHTKSTTYEAHYNNLVDKLAVAALAAGRHIYRNASSAAGAAGASSSSSSSSSSRSTSA